MKGKTTKPLKILIHPELEDGFEDERKAGHTVEASPAIEGYDLVMGKNCWRMPRSLLRHKLIAIRAARKEKE